MKKVLVLFLILSISTFAKTVFITKTGKRWHGSKSCSGLSRAKSIFPVSFKEAQSRGLTHCKKE